MIKKLKLGLIGEKLTHSHSPKIHEEIMKRNGINGEYALIEVKEKDLKDKIIELKNSEYQGLNITLPYKTKAMKYMDEIDEKANYIGAINTVSIKDGVAKGYNTDYDGFLSLFNNNNISVNKKDIIILGAGGAAKAVAKALLDSKAYDLTIVTRSKGEFHNIYSTSYEYIAENPTNCDILINCTPVGMYPKMNETPIDSKYIKTPVYIDLIYNPKKTKLMEQYEKEGTTVIGGYNMLVEQALEAHRIWARDNII